MSEFGSFLFGLFDAEDIILLALYAAPLMSGILIRGPFPSFLCHSHENDLTGIDKAVSVFM